MTTAVSYRDVLAVLRSADATERASLVEALPPSPMKDAAAPLVRGDDRAGVVIGVGVLAQSYSFGLNAALGAELSRAGFELAREVWAAQPPGGPLLITTVSGLAAAVIRSLKLQGRSEEAVTFAESAVPYLESEGDTENLPTIRTDLAEALLQLGRVDEAERILARVRAGGGFAPDLDRLAERIRAIKRPVTDLAPPAPTNEGNPAATVEGHAALRGLADLITAMVTRSSEEMNESTAMKISRDATAIFLDERLGRQPEALRDSLAKLESVRRWSSAQQAVDVENDALWGIYLCLSRLARPSEAADALLGLRRNVERQRAGIANPVERGGVSVRYPYLYPALCQMLARSGRADELLDSIEAAKGRAVADLLVKRSGRPVADGDQAAASGLAELMRRVGAHYLSYLVDDEAALAVLVASDGSLHLSGEIPLGKEELRAASRLVDPRTWGSAESIDLWATKTEDVPTTLSPLVDWLGPLLDNGVLKPGDHLCYSPDEHLHQIPLHYVRLRGEPLVSSFSVSRTHGSRLLSLLLAKDARRPAEFSSFLVPSRGDGTSVRETMARVPAWLAGHLSGTRSEGESVTPGSVARANLTDRLVHFVTHGYFPPEGYEGGGNPYDSSGLLLTGLDGLPDLTNPGRGERLSPKVLLDSGLDLSGSHVSLGACVTGLAREGIGGDALGLDWALFQCGAASLLASHWNVSASLSAPFFERFYDRWVLQGMSRAQAWRSTVLSMRGEDGPASSPYAWGAFSLSGDWR